MKKIQFLSSLLVILLAIACKNAATDTTSTTMTDSTAMAAAVDTMVAQMDTTAMAFACTMHPDVMGKEGDKCSKCGMALVASKKAEPGHEGHNH